MPRCLTLLDAYSQGLKARNVMIPVCHALPMPMYCNGSAREAS
jgi:hypothetical protein